MVKARIGEIEIEGSAAEIADILKSLPFHLSSPKVGKRDQQEHAVAASERFVDSDVAFRALKRRPLSDEQRVLLATLKTNYPDWTLAKDLQKATKYNANQLAGLLGALGKRIGSTEGYRSGTWLFDQEWDYDYDCNRYRLPPSVLAAVQRAGI